MKAIRLLAICCFVLMLALSISGYLGTAEASEYFVGNLCFSYSCVEGFQGYLSLGYFGIGDLHYVVSGTFNQTAPTEVQGIYHGNAEILGSALKSTLISSASGPSSATIITADFVTDINTLTGTLKGIRTEMTSTNDPASGYLSCTTVFITCP